MTLLVADNLQKKLGEVEVLRGVSFELESGKIVSLVGPSGSGKSTLLRCLNLLEVPDHGELHWCQQPIDYRGMSGSELSSYRRRLGMVFQHFHLFPHLTVLANVSIGPRHVLGWSRSRAEAQAYNLLARVGLEDYAQRAPERLSGGQKQRVAIARALALEPEALLLDEVTSALDVESSAEIHRLLEELSSSIPMVLVTHDLNFARSVSHRCCFMESGKILESGPPEQVLDDPVSLRARRFLEAAKTR